MNTLRHILILATGIFTLVMTACRKQDYKAGNVVPPTDNTALIAGLNLLKGSIQVIEVTAGVYTEIRLAQGTKLRFYPFSFKDANGVILKSGTVQVSVLEAYGAGAGIANRLAHMSGNQLLQNGGQVWIDCHKDGEEVMANKYGVCFLAPTHSEDPMALYYGTGGFDDSMTRWMRVGNMTGTAVQGTVLDTQSVYYVDSSAAVDTAKILRNYNQFDSVGAWGWVGCDYPYTTGSTLTDITVTPASQSFDNSNTAVFLVIPGVKTVVPVTEYNKVTHSFSLPTGYHVPADITVHLIMLSYKEGRLYYFQQTGFTLTHDMTFSPALQEHTATEIYNLLNLL